MFETFISDLSEKLKKPLPGEQAQYIMAPQGRRNFPINKNKGTAAVLMLLYPINNEPWLVFIKRPEYNGAHSGQISLPGGKTEEVDKTLYNTALRETSEELGIDTSTVKYLGKLSPLHIPVSGFTVHPFISYSPALPIWNADPAEVSYLLETSLSRLLEPSTIKKETWVLHHTETEVPFYHIKNEKIWGATAMIIAEFKAVLAY